MKGSIILTTILLLTISGCSKKEPENKPNIIFILADDLGYGDVGFNGQTKILTPNVDRIASEGMVFTDHYSGSTVCGPSRAVLMTGFHTGHCAVRGNPKWTASGAPVGLVDKDVTVAEELKRAGYTTGVIGKWGLAETLGEGIPNRQGFDYFYGFNTHKAAHHYYPEKIWENDQEVTLEGNDSYNKNGKYSQYLFTEKAVDFIEDNKDEPFFLYLTYTIPHFELTTPIAEKQVYRDVEWPLRKMKPAHYRHDENGHITYASMVTLMDKDIGLIIDKLQELGIKDNTLVIFTSDNGHEYDNNNEPFFDSNGKLKGKKRDLYEGGVRVPFAAYWPNQIKPGTKSNHISAFWDFLPTVCDIAGISPTVDVDGISYLPTLLGEPQEQHKYLYWEFNEKRGPIQAVREGDWKAVRFKNKKIQLYNLVRDIGENNDLSEDFPSIAARMDSLLDNTRTEHPEFPLIKKIQKK